MYDKADGPRVYHSLTYGNNISIILNNAKLSMTILFSKRQSGCIK